MKKYIPVSICAIILSIIFYACSNNTTGKTPDSSSMAKESSLKQTAATVYTCKMHPEVTSDKPGKCPKCGMDLVKKESMPKNSSMQGMKMDSTKK